MVCLQNALSSWSYIILRIIYWSVILAYENCCFLLVTCSNDETKKPEPDEQKDLFVEEVDWKHTLNRVVVHILLLTHLDIWN